VSGSPTPLWRWLAVGALCACAAVYFLVTGEIAINKARTVIITPASQPLGYWLTVAVLSLFAVLCLRKAWQGMRSG
jgi:hypothetical protein